MLISSRKPAKMKYDKEKTKTRNACHGVSCVFPIENTAPTKNYRLNRWKRLKPKVRIFHFFCFNHIITDILFIYNYTKLQSRINKISSNRVHFNKNPSMRALAKILQARASEHPCNFCEQFKQSGPNFASTFKLNGTIRYSFQCVDWTGGKKY